jgi:hypothetical protein
MRIALGGSEREEETKEISNGGGGGNELVNSAIPHYAIYIFWEKDRGLRRGAKIGNGSPLTVKNRAAR